MNFWNIAAQTLGMLGPLLLVALAGCAADFGGQRNDGLEGMALAGGICAVLLSGRQVQWPLLLGAGCLTGMLLALALGLCLRRGAGPQVAGMGLNLLGWGVLLMLTEGYDGRLLLPLWEAGLSALTQAPLPAGLPVLGAVCAVALALGMLALLFGTPWGLRLRAVRLDAWKSARRGLFVHRYRGFTLLCSGGLAGLGGALLALLLPGHAPLVGLGYGGMVLAALSAYRPQRALPLALLCCASAAIYLETMEISLAQWMAFAPPSMRLGLLGIVLVLLAASGLLRRARRAQRGAQYPSS